MTTPMKYNYHCGKCGGFVPEPNVAYGYSGQYCSCEVPTPPIGDFAKDMHDIGRKIINDLTTPMREEPQSECCKVGITPFGTCRNCGLPYKEKVYKNGEIGKIEGIIYGSPTPSQPTSIWEDNFRRNWANGSFSRNGDIYEGIDFLRVMNALREITYKLHLEAVEKGRREVLDVAEGMFKTVGQSDVLSGEQELLYGGIYNKALEDLLSKFPKHN